MKLFERNVYHLKHNGKRELGVYLCRSVKKGRYYFIPLSDASQEYSHKLTTLNKYAVVAEMRELKMSDILKALYIGGKTVKLTKDEYVKCYLEMVRYKLDNEKREIASHVFSTRELVKFFEESIKFINWQKEKFYLNFKRDNNMSVFENGLYWVDFGYNVGTELNKQRPAIIWKKILNPTNPNQNSYICIPISTKVKGSRYYYNVPINIDGDIYYARVGDMLRLNQKRIKRPRSDHNNSIHYITSTERDAIKDAISKYYVF